MRNRALVVRAAILALASAALNSAVSQNTPSGTDSDEIKLLDLGPCEGIHLGSCVKLSCTTIRVVDEKGVVMKGQKLRLRTLMITWPTKGISAFQVGMSKPIAKLRTDETGNFSLVRIPEGKYLLEAPTPNGSAFITLVLERQRTSEECSVRLQLNKGKSTLTILEPC